MDHVTPPMPDLRDPHKYERVANVPVFRAHKRTFYGPDGKPAETVEVTDADLDEICRVANEQARSGHLAPLTEGHRNFHPDYPEARQPKLLGFSGGVYRVAMVHPPGGKPYRAIVEDEYVAKENAYALKQYPYRSLDYDVKAKKVLGTAFLIRQPFLEMGTTVVYQGGPMNDQDSFTDDEVKMYERCARYFNTKKYFAPMGAGNGGMPEPAAAPYQADPAAVAQYASQLAGLQAQLDAERAARVDAECRAVLDPLKAIRKFDYNRELAALKAYQDPAARVGHANYIVANYQPQLGAVAAVPVLPGAVAPAPAAGDPHQAPADHSRVMAYMRGHPGTSYEQAELAVAAAK